MFMTPKVTVIVTMILFSIMQTAKCNYAVHDPDLFWAGRDTIKQSLLTPNILTGMMLIATGATGSFAQWPVDKAVNNYRNRQFGGFSTRADDYLTFIPAVFPYIIKLTDPYYESSYLAVSLKLFSAALLAQGVTQATKYLTKVPRPINGSSFSFPSGHTSVAFALAAVTSRELKTPWISTVSYALATTTALLRLANNEHWLSDVVAGAGLGIIAGELTFLLFEKMKKHDVLSGINKSFSFTPYASLSCYGFSFLYKL
ncbi:MAG: phosphatase PAP2 family protein [Bacteroidales bacterium]|nr:phosphatase PAP2 family protein [Bacteroidales bacterium]